MSPVTEQLYYYDPQLCQCVCLFVCLLNFDQEYLGREARTITGPMVGTSSETIRELNILKPIE